MNLNQIRDSVVVLGYEVAQRLFENLDPMGKMFGCMVSNLMLLVF